MTITRIKNWVLSTLLNRRMIWTFWRRIMNGRRSLSIIGIYMRRRMSFWRRRVGSRSWKLRVIWISRWVRRWGGEFMRRKSTSSIVWMRILWFRDSMRKRGRSCMLNSNWNLMKKRLGRSRLGRIRLRRDMKRRKRKPWTSFWCWRFRKNWMLKKIMFSSKKNIRGR